MTTQAKHTPGPWLPVSLTIGKKNFWRVMSREGNLPETKANATIQALAPKMAERLEANAVFMEVLCADLPLHSLAAGKMREEAARTRALLAKLDGAK